MSIPTPVLNAVPANLDTLVSLAARDVEVYERHVLRKREELAAFEQRLTYLRETADYWKRLQNE